MASIETNRGNADIRITEAIRKVATADLTKISESTKDSTELATSADAAQKAGDAAVSAATNGLDSVSRDMLSLCKSLNANGTNGNGAKNNTVNSMCAGLLARIAQQKDDLIKSAADSAATTSALKAVAAKLKLSSSRASAAAADAILNSNAKASNDPKVKAMHAKLTGQSETPAETNETKPKPIANASIVLPPPPAKKAAKVAIAIDYAAVKANEAAFKKAFAMDIAVRLGVESDKVTVKKITPGSVNVEFTVLLPRMVKSESGAAASSTKADAGQALADALSESATPLALPSVKTTMNITKSLKITSVQVTTETGEVKDLSKTVANAPIPSTPPAPKPQPRSKTVAGPQVKNMSAPCPAPAPAPKTEAQKEKEEDDAIAAEEKKAEEKAAAEEGKVTKEAQKDNITSAVPSPQKPCDKKKSLEAKAAARKKIFDSKVAELKSQTQSLQEATSFVELAPCDGKKSNCDGGKKMAPCDGGKK